MFTGIVEELGRLRGRRDGPDGARLSFEAPSVAADATVGASVAVNGVCLTVVEAGEGWWGADAVAETLRRSTLGELAVGDPVNLERPVRAEDRLGGHLVQGHVDGVGVVVSPAPDLVVSLPEDLAAYVVHKGSVAVDGVSLTVASCRPGQFGVAVIPHTAEVTTLGRLAVGSRVNLEVDVVAKYVERLLSAGAPSPYRPEVAR